MSCHACAVSVMVTLQRAGEIGCRCVLLVSVGSRCGILENAGLKCLLYNQMNVGSVKGACKGCSAVRGE